MSELAHAEGATAPNPLMTSTPIRENKLGGISYQTFWRYCRDLGFPEPDVVVNRVRYWRESTVDAWIVARTAIAKSRKAQSANTTGA